MMLIAAGLTAALLGAASLVADRPEASLESAFTAAPPVVVTVLAGPGVSATLVSRLLEETAAVWRPGGFEFVWQRAPRGGNRNPRPAEDGPYFPPTLRVIIGDKPGVARDRTTPLGWIVFDGEHEPQREIYLSRANAEWLMTTARSVVGVVARMPPSQREALLGRAMGRALAHELGHYLLASKVHTERGLLKARWSAAELFTTARSGLGIDAAQRQQIAARLRGESAVASR